MQDLPSPRPSKEKRHSSHFVQDARDKINRTISFMEKEYKRAISREQLAAIAELNSEHYSRIFRKYTGSSPMNYLVELRINKAKELLLHSTYSIAEIGHNGKIYLPCKMDMCISWKQTSTMVQILLRFVKR